MGLPRFAGWRQRVDDVRAITIPSNSRLRHYLLPVIRQCLVDQIMGAVPHNPLGVGVVAFRKRRNIAFFGSDNEDVESHEHNGKAAMIPGWGKNTQGALENKLVLLVDNKIRK